MPTSNGTASIRLPLMNRASSLLATALMLVSIAALTHSKPVFGQETITTSHGISTFGDLKYAADFKHLDYVNPDAPKGGEFSTWAFGTFDSMTPYILKGSAAAGSPFFFESLMTGTADEPDSMYGLLAETIEFPEDRQWAIFNLRPEAKFSDGTQVTAEDVVFSFNVLIEKGRPSFQITFSDFENVEALSPTEVKFTFKEGSNTRELPQAAAGLPIFSKAYYADRDFAESTLDPPLGSGRYVLNDVDPGKSVSYTRRDDYWGDHLAINQGRENFQTMTFEYYADYTAAFEGFKGNAYNFREEYSSKVWATAYDFPALENGWVIKTQLPDQNPSGTQGFWFNLRRDKFSDPRVREALGLMFNFEWSNEALFYNIYKRTDSFWENSTLQATGLPSTAELQLLEPLAEHFPASVLSEPAFVPRISKPDQLDRATLRKAAKLLEAAGWTLIDGRRVDANGQVVTIEILNDSPSFERIINPYVENLKRLGIDIVLNSVDNAQSTEREKFFDFDITTRRYVMSQTPGLELRSIFHSDTADKEGSANIMGLKNEGVDGLLDLIEKAETREELNIAVSALDRVLRSLHIWVPQWHNSMHNVSYLDVFSYPEKLPPFSIGEMDFWWYDAEKAARLEAAGAL
jgi:microcin C transport system substrate-binding protein